MSFGFVFCFSSSCRFLEGSGYERAVLWKVLSAKKLKRHMVSPPFYSISCRCRLLEGFDFGFVFLLLFEL